MSGKGSAESWRRALELAVECQGIYPLATVDAEGTRTERTAWQDGWNACHSDLVEKAGVIAKALSELPARCAELIDAEVLSVSVQDGNVSLFVNCSDLFWWGCADGEGFELSDLPDLEKALSECSKFGDLLWCCRKRGMRPQKPYYKRFDAAAALFDACGPEREV